MAYIEQYKLYVQSADNNSARRVSTNRYQTSLNVAIVALYGIAEAFAPQTTAPIAGGTVVLIGIIISATWWGSIRSMRRLNEEKFKIIHSMEKHLPRAVYYEEWQGLEEGKGREYRSANKFEQAIPVVFAVLHAGAGLYFGLPFLQATFCAV